MAETTKTIVEHAAAGRFQEAIAIHAGEIEDAKDAPFRSQVHIKRCKSCDQHWIKFTVSKRSRDDWKEISDVGFESFTDEPISTVPSVQAR